MAKQPKSPTPPEELEEVVLSGGGGSDGGSDGGNGGGDGGGPGGGDEPGDGSPQRPWTVRLSPSSEDPRVRTELALWEVIGRSTHRSSFANYARFMDSILYVARDGNQAGRESRVPFRKRDSAFPRPYNVYGGDAYDLVSTATEMFLMAQTGRLGDLTWLRSTPIQVDIEVIRGQQHQYYEALIAEGHDSRIMPYLDLIRQKLADLPIKDEFSVGTAPGEYGILRGRIDTPAMIELIWSYWLEQGMLVQTMSAISLRFQNKRTDELVDPLANLAIDPLRTLNNLLWGFVKDEANRLSLPRRAFEYDQEYGLTLSGKAVPRIKSVDRRSKFIECFHNLLHECTKFFVQRDDLTMRADGFPLLNTITDVHLLLAEGANNQFGDLPWTARKEMMVMQWLLARPEFREFLGGRIMVPYAEPWMDRVDTMRMLQSWGDVSITSFYYLAVYGEQILLTLRYGNWTEIHDAGTAAAWADRWRPAIQTYVHHYRRVTGVDLGADVVDGRDGQDRYLQPSLHLVRRLAEQHVGGASLPPPASLAALPGPGVRAEGARRISRTVKAPAPQQRS
jgi:hypothetical protein